MIARNRPKVEAKSPNSKRVRTWKFKKTKWKSSSSQLQERRRYVNTKADWWRNKTYQISDIEQYITSTTLKCSNIHLCI